MCQPLHVMPGLVPGIPPRDALWPPKRDGREKPGHDGGKCLGWTAIVQFIALISGLTQPHIALGGIQAGQLSDGSGQTRQCDISTGTVMDARSPLVAPPRTNSRSLECP